MAWNDPNDAPWDVGDVLTSQSLKDYVRDNLVALRALNFASKRLGGGITTTSTSFVDMDANSNVDIEISSDRLLCIATFNASRPVSGGFPQGTGYFDLAVNQDASFSTIVRASNHANGLVSHSAADQFVVLIGYWIGLEPGNKTISIQGRTSNASYGTTILSNTTINILAWEV